jgi:ribosome-binding protein aMBF1 (putative translation factor)
MSRENIAAHYTIRHRQVQKRKPKQKNEAVQKALGERIRELRSKRGWSQEEFADICELHRTYMGSIERGERNLTIVSVLTVARHLDLTLSQLLSGLEKRAGFSP